MNDLKSVARRLRNDATSAERRLWGALRRRGVEGFRFRRQVELLGYVVDFACFEARLIIEVDGATHSTESEVQADARREAWLVEAGNCVLRFTNTEVYENLDGVLETVRLKLLDRRPNGAQPPERTSAVPSPLVGEG